MHTRQFADSEGDFSQWAKLTEPCRQLVTRCTRCSTPLRDIRQDHPGICRCGGYITDVSCGAPVRGRLWESHDGGYEDYQYRCDNGHVWWVDGIDS